MANANIKSAAKAVYGVKLLIPTRDKYHDRLYRRIWFMNIEQKNELYTRKE